MAKDKITSLGPDLLRELKRMLTWWRSRNNSDRDNAPRDVPIAPDDYVVYTPSGGIAARSGTTIYGELCTVYRETGDITSGTMTLAKCTTGSGADYQLRVYNVGPDDIDGDAYIHSTRLKSGVRYTEQTPRLKRVKLTETIANNYTGDAEVMTLTCGSGSCSYSVAQDAAEVTLCNATGRKLYDNEEVWATSSGSCLVAMPTPRPMRLRGTLSARLACGSGSTPSVTFTRYIDHPNWTGSEGTRTYDNPLGWGASNGSVVFAQWDETTEKWSIDGVQHEERTVLTDAYLGSGCIAGDLLDICTPTRTTANDVTENECLITTTTCP